jgi:hypothetical protein
MFIVIFVCVANKAVILCHSCILTGISATVAFVAIKGRVVAYEHKSLVRKCCSCKGIYCMALLTVMGIARVGMIRRPLIIVHVTGIAVII